MSIMGNSICIMVLGMHRSGTSFTTRIINLLGIPVGKYLVPPLPNDNETGFWEPQDVVDLNEAALINCSLDHLTPKLMPKNWQKQGIVPSLATRIPSLLKQEYENEYIFALKDPRICRTAPLWIDALHERGSAVCCLFVVRNPLEVAKSLHKRNGISIRDGLILWMLYNLEAEKHSRNLKRHFVGYPHVMEDWQKHFNHIGSSLEIRWPLQPKDIAHTVDEFIRPDLRHNKASNELNEKEIDADIKPLLKATYITLASACATQKINTNQCEKLENKLESLLTPNVKKKIIRYLSGIA